MVPALFLAVSLLGAAATLSALMPGRRLGPFVVPYFFWAWLTGELALHHIAWQAAATLVFIGLGALAAWPGWLGLGITALSFVGLVRLHDRGDATRVALEGALRDAGIPAALPRIPKRHYARPFRMRHAEVERIPNLAYGEHGRRNLLDVYRPRRADAPGPVLLQIHGGGWVIGQKDQQGLPLMTTMAARGWMCVAPNYRLSPTATFPDHLIDVKRALAWIRRHAAEYGGDPNMVAVTGGSAGGHLAALVALTANDPALQPGFEEIDTSVVACVPFYGVYDFLDRHGVRGRQTMTPFLERVVMKCSPSAARARWDAASPIACVAEGVPPFFVIHGTHDSLAYVEDARHFVAALRSRSMDPVCYAELPGAQHAFDVFHSRRSAYAVAAVARFLDHVCGRVVQAESADVEVEPVVLARA